MAQCIHRLIALQSKKVSKNYIWIAITAPFPVLGHSNNVWDISGQVLGHETFFFFGTFRDISKTKIPWIRSGTHSGGPSIEANQPTEPGTFVWRTAISEHFGTFWENVKYGGKKKFQLLLLLFFQIFFWYRYPFQSYYTLSEKCCSQLDYGNVRNLIARPGVFGAIVR